MPTQNDALATKLTIQALRQSSAFNVPLHFPTQGGLSNDVELRTDGNTTPPPMDRMQSTLSLFGQKAKLAWMAAQGKDPYAQPALDSSFYKPGQDASSVPINAPKLR